MDPTCAALGISIDLIGRDCSANDDICVNTAERLMFIFGLNFIVWTNQRPVGEGAGPVERPTISSASNNFC